jgi:hypothetical protein
MTTVGIEPTPLLITAWSQRLRPLGQTVNVWVRLQPHAPAGQAASRPTQEERPVTHMRVSACAGGSLRPPVKLINNFCDAPVREENHLRHEPEEQPPQKSSRDSGIGICRTSKGLEGEGGKAHTGRQNSVEGCRERCISAAAGTIANDINATSTKFAPGRLGCDPNLTSAATAHLGERQGADLRAPGLSPSLGITA